MASASLVDMRAEMQPHLKTDKRLLCAGRRDGYVSPPGLTWASLELRRIKLGLAGVADRKLIKYEAVHTSAAGPSKNRLDSDRRCYGFFTPRLPDEPLIFVEVALDDAMADSITPLLDRGRCCGPT